MIIMMILLLSSDVASADTASVNVVVTISSVYQCSLEKNVLTIQTNTDLLVSFIDITGESRTEMITDSLFIIDDVKSFDIIPLS